MRGLERYYLKKKHTPKWVDKNEQSYINQIYKRSTEKGKGYHVDHIVPLVHPRVCGLHCLKNLKILTSAENLKKGNYYWPDMWMEPVELELDCCKNHQMRLF